MPESTDDRTRAAEIHRRLLAAYGEPSWRPHYEPMDELVLTFLSQNTSDVNSGRAFASLKARYPTWQSVLEAPVDEVAETIRSGGLAQQKAPRIRNALRRIQAERGEFSLDFLADLPVDEAMRWLTSFDGIGPQDRVDCPALLFPQAGIPGRYARGARDPAPWAGGTAGQRREDQADLGGAGAAGVVLPAASEPDPSRPAGMSRTAAGVRCVRAG